MCYTARQYNSRAARLMELKVLLKDVEKQIADIESEIKADMGDTEEVTTDKFAITWKTIVSNRFDQKSFKAAHEKLFEQFVKPSASRRFEVKEVQ